MSIRQLFLWLLICFTHTCVYSFGQDVCFQQTDDPAVNKIVNCIGVGQACRTSHLTPEMEVQCRLDATLDSVKGLLGGVVGGRSLVHSDAVYFMSQLMGYSAWQAYEMAIYSEATDQSLYTPFDQNGAQLLSKETIEACQEHWGEGMANECLLMTQKVSGLSRFNSTTGGTWLHLHARYSSEGSRLPETPFPVDYFAPEYAHSEKLLHDFHAWVFDEKSEMCVYGITQDGVASHCASPSFEITSPIHFFVFGLPKVAIPLVTSLGPFKISEEDASQPVFARNASLQAYIAPHEAAYAKMGMFSHALADRYSHHMCSDRSYFEQDADGNYNAHFDLTYCAQGSHFLWHVWEQGTQQDNANLDPQFQTMRPALIAMYDQLLAYAAYQHIPIHIVIDRDKMIDQLIAILGVYDPSERLAQMVQLMEDYQVLPLPGHGSVINDTLEQWLNLAGAPVLTTKKTR